MNVLSIFAHPDDETMMVGGTLALLSRNGAQVYFISATRGEGGENGEPPLCTLEELGGVREQELRCAVRALGGAGLEFLGYVDPRVGPDNQLFSYSSDLALMVDQVKEMADRLDAQVIFTHGSNGEYGHPAHLFTHQAVRHAVEDLGERGPLLYTAHANYPDHPRPRLANKDDPAHLIVDIRPVLKQKQAAAMCHLTQHDLFVRNASKEAGRLLTVPEVILPVESLHRVYPPASNPLHDILADWLRETSLVQER
jgi:N-acetylglucosamine malate deacetylase 2